MLIVEKLFHIRNKILISLFVLFASFSFAYASDISITPNTGTFTVGKTFTIDVNITSNTQAINAVAGAISFPEDLLSVKSISKDGSIIKLWAEEPSFSNSVGSIKFEGVVLNPGFSGATGKVVSITFNVKAEGNGALSFSSGSVLANDGQATNVLGNLNGGNYSFEITTVNDKPKEKVATPPSPNLSTNTDITPQLISSTHPDSNAWYKSRDVSFSWDVPNGVTAVRTLYDEHDVSTPSKVYDPAISNRNFTVDKDGVYYMHVQFKNAKGWGPIAHYKFQIDSAVPSYLKLSMPSGSDSYDPTPILLIDTKDSLSGIDHATIKVNNDSIETIKVEQLPNYRLSVQTAGAKTATVAVFDKAGNTLTQSIDFNIIAINPPTVTDYTKSGEQGDVLKVIGTTYPNGTVEVVYTDNNGIRNSDTTKSDVDGNFTLLWTKKLDHGAYELKVRVTDSRGATSEYTNPRAVLIERKTYIQFGMFIINWLTLILLIIIASVSILATLWLALLQFGRFRRKIHRNIHDVEVTLKSNVQALRRDTEEFHSVLVKAEKTRKLTKEENMILRKFKKRIEITEKEIEQKLEQIG